MNGTFIFVLSIITIVMCANIIRTYLKQRAREPQADENIEETLARLETLEQRVQVLERIVTENRFDLKQEIDAL